MADDYSKKIYDNLKKQLILFIPDTDNNLIIHLDKINNIMKQSNDDYIIYDFIDEDNIVFNILYLRLFVYLNTHNIENDIIEDINIVNTLDDLKFYGRIKIKNIKKLF